MKKDTLTLQKLTPYSQKDNNTLYPSIKSRKISPLYKNFLIKEVLQLAKQQVFSISWQGWQMI